MQQLQTRIETGEHRHDRKAQVAREARVLANAETQPQDGDTAGIGAECELADQLLRLEQVARDPGRGLFPVDHLLGEERRVVRPRAIDRLAGFDDEPAHRARRRCAANEHVHRPDHIRLVDRSIVVRGVDHHCQVDDRIDSQLTHQLADHGQTRVGMDEVHLLECAEWVVNIAPEEVRHLRGEAPSHLRAKRIGDAGDEDAAGLVREHQPPNLMEWS